MKVVITGATGFVGAALVAKLVARGESVTALTRDANKTLAGATMVAADLETPGPWCEALAGCDAIVHLAGEPIGAHRWDARRKQRIRESRVESTRVIVEAIAKLPSEARPRVLVSASGTDYYPFSHPPMDDDDVTEKDPPADSFLGRLCRDWEREARAAEAHGVRVVRMRTGIVLGGGGALAKMATPFKLFAGGPVGNGKQFISWIHRDDVVDAYATATTDARYTGAINLVTGSVRAKPFAQALGKAMHRPSWLPVPGFALRAAVGELAEYLLNGRNVVPAKLEALGFPFAHRALDEALAASV